MEKQRNPKSVCSRIGLAVFAMLLVWLVSLQVALMLAPAEFADNGWGLLLLNDATLYVIGVPVFLLILHFIPDGPATPTQTATKFGVGKFVLCLIFCFGITWFINIAGQLLITALQAIFATGGQTTNNVAELVEQNTFWSRFLLGAVTPALGEEFLFRYMLRRKLRGAGDKIYIFFSALCFGLFHMNLVQGFYAFVIGVVFAWAYVMTGKLWVPMALHFLLNMMGIVVAPSVLDNTVGMMILGIVMLVFIPTAIVFFFVFRKKVMATMAPPSEAGWPHKPPKAAMQPWPPYAYMPAAAPWGAPYAPGQPYDAYGIMPPAAPAQDAPATQGAQPVEADSPGSPDAAPAQQQAVCEATQGASPSDAATQQPVYETPQAADVPPYDAAYTAQVAQPPYDAPYPAYYGYPQQAPGYPAYPYGGYAAPYGGAAGAPIAPGVGGVPYSYDAWRQAVAPYPYQAAVPYPHQAWAPQGSAVKVCIGNVGMILFLCLSGIMVALNLLVMLVM